MLNGAAQYDGLASSSRPAGCCSLHARHGRNRLPRAAARLRGTVDTDIYAFIVTVAAWLVVFILGYFQRRATASGPSRGWRAWLSHAAAAVKFPILYLVSRGKLVGARGFEPPTPSLPD